MQARHEGRLHELELELDRSNSKASIHVIGSGGSEVQSQTTNHLYRGQLAGDPDSHVAAFLVGEELYVLVLPQDRSQGWTLSPDRDEPGSYEAVSTADAMELMPPMSCGFVPPSGSGLQPVTGGTSQSTAANRQSLEIALDSDFEFYQWQGGSPTECAAFMVGTLSLASLYYEIDLNIRLLATEVRVRTDPGEMDYPYSGSTNPLAGMINWWSQYVGEPFQAVHLFSGRGSFGPGTAYPETLCQDTPFRMVGFHGPSFNGSFSGRVKAVAHEIGHNAGAFHTLSGIMSGNNPPPLAGTTGAHDFSFHPHSIGEINGFLATLPSGCLPGMVAGTEAPVAGTVNPGALSTTDSGLLSITGSHLNNVTEVQVDQEILTLVGNKLEHVSETEIHVNFLFSAWGAIGARPITVSGPGGDSTTTVQVNPPLYPHLGTNPYSIFPGSVDFELTAFYEPNWTAAFVWSDSDATVPQGQLKILENPMVMGVQTLDAAGRATIQWSSAPAGYQVGDTVYMQVVTFHPSNGTRNASDVFEVCICLP